MKARTRIRISAAIVFVLAVQMFSWQAAAAEGSVSISSETSVERGGSFTVTVRYSENVGRVDASLRYDSDMLEYVSGGNSDGSGGLVKLSKAASGERIVFELTFKATRSGESAIRVKTDEMYDYDEQAMNRPSSKTTVIVADETAAAGDDENGAADADDSGQEAQQDNFLDSNGFVVLGGGAVLVALALITVIILYVRKKRKQGR